MAKASVRRPAATRGKNRAASTIERIEATNHRIEGETAELGPEIEISADHRSISREAIGARAYEIWIEEGKPEGRAVDHWVQAERELRERL